VSFIVNDGGQLEVGPPEDDPIRRTNARITEALALKFELDQQVLETLSASEYRQREQIAALESRVAMLEELLLGTSAAAGR
jgi:hypothetical protein